MIFLPTNPNNAEGESELAAAAILDKHHGGAGR